VDGDRPALGHFVPPPRAPSVQIRRRRGGGTTPQSPEVYHRGYNDVAGIYRFIVYWLTVVSTKTLDFASQFRQCRKQRNLSVMRLVDLSGISKTAIENWQSGRTLPSAPELEVLISVLNLSTFDQRLLRRSVGLPRAIARLPEGERPPLTGGLLRAMRLRRGLTQSEVARRLSVRQGTLAKWEKSDDWPEADKLGALCAVLGATPQEAEAILGGIFLPLSLPLNASREVFEQQVQVLHDRVHLQPNDPLLDLAFLELESQLWLDGDHTATQELLWRTWSFHINYLSMQHRYEEMLPYANVMLTIPFNPRNRSESHLQVAVIQKAQALRGSSDTGRGQKTRYKKAITFLDANQGRVVDNECLAWYWMELVHLNIRMGSYEVARTCLKRSNAIPHHQCVRGTMGESALVTAQSLTNLGSPREAIALLHSPTLGRDDPSFSILMEMRLHFYHAEALAKLEDFTGALEVLGQLYKAIEIRGIEVMRHRADALFSELTHLP
jgi:transcriptional regulator with XRE-family HTH domain